MVIGGVGEGGTATVALGGRTMEAAAQNDSRTIDNQLERMKQEEEGKIKMLLLGAGESGKSTIFKQMRLLYGTERSDDDLRMYGVVVRSNIVVAVRKLCSHLRNLGLEEELDRESRENEDLEDGDHSAMTIRQAYDELMAYLVDNTATASEMEGVGVNGGSGGGGGSRAAGRRQRRQHGDSGGRVATAVAARRRLRQRAEARWRWYQRGRSAESASSAATASAARC